MEMDASEVREVSLTWMLREQGEFLVSQLASGCVTCHTCHGCVTDFRPILGNPVEVAHMTSPGTVYISHAKGTYFPLARISNMIPL